MESTNKYIHFDWVVKRMLRDKANFAVLEGLITVLFGRKITIVEILENKEEQDNARIKFNRVYIKSKEENGDIIIVKVQLHRELYYRYRIVCGVLKTITESIHIGDMYDKVKKVYSINILYFDLGKGSDYLYHGKTIFTGVHTGDHLQLSTNEYDEIRMRTPEKISPEYYIIRVCKFHGMASTSIGEWLFYLKNNKIKDKTTTPGLREAGERLLYYKMPDKERHAYDAHMDNIMVQNDVLDTAKMEGRAEGRAEATLSNSKSLR